MQSKVRSWKYAMFAVGLRRSRNESFTLGWFRIVRYGPQLGKTGKSGCTTKDGTAFSVNRFGTKKIFQYRKRWDVSGVAKLPPKNVGLIAWIFFRSYSHFFSESFSDYSEERHSDSCLDGSRSARNSHRTNGSISGKFGMHKPNEHLGNHRWNSSESNLAEGKINDPCITSDLSIKNRFIISVWRRRSK